MIRRLSVSLPFIFIFSFSFAQKGVIRGTVTDKNTGEPMTYTNVILKGTTTGGTTDLNGFFSISDITPGDYTLFCTNIGYDTSLISVTVKANDIITEKIFLEQKGVQLSNVTINAEKEAKKTETNIGLTKLTAKDIQRLPSVGGEHDLAQYLQVIPGIIFTGDQGGELYIRGGSPIQNKVLLDGMTIYNPFHSIGLFSVFETDIIKNVNVITGGFSAEYGGRMNAVVDVATRDGNKKRFAGKISASPFMSKILIESPLKKIDKEGNSISWLFDAKSSYLNRTSKKVYTYIDTAGLPYAFNDFYGKFSMNSGSGSKLNLFGFNFTDHVNYNGVSDFNWNTYGGGTNFVLVPGGSNMLIGGSLSYSDYKIQLQEADEKPRTSRINGFDLSTYFTYFLPHSSEVKYGFTIGGYRTEFEFFNSLGLRIGQDQNTTEIGGYVTLKKVWDRVVFEPSFRIQYYASLPVFSPEPRIAIKYNLNENVRLKGSAGIYTQNFISTKSDKDVVNLFSGYLTGPDQELDGIDGEVTKDNLQRAYHTVGGVEFDVTKHLDLTVESYYKYFGQLINLNRNKQYPTDPDFQIETGNAYGVDVLFKYDFNNLYIWTGYSLGFIHRNNGEQIYPPHYDRRHNANVVVSYTFGKNKQWQADARWNLGSGFPFTRTQGFYEFFDFLDGINTNYVNGNGQLGIIYDSTLNAGRLPFYHRLDISLKRVFKLSENSVFEANASIINVYNRKNIFYFDRVRYQRVNQLPILPSIGVNLTF
ncbi:MAG TPA: TonB-dependent receptor [Bacteroidetes bacterium]|nr:TonB-dependent receptor [Bacteroidota bacterium]